MSSISSYNWSLPDGIYNIGDVGFRTIDNSDNISTVVLNTSQIIIDTVPPSPPEVSFPSGTTYSGLVSITLGTGAALWKYSFTPDVWITGAGTSIMLEQGVYDTNTVKVYNSDLAGNQSEIVVNDSDFTVHTSFTLSDKTTYNIGDIKVRVIDTSGNISDVEHNQISITVDLTPPNPPTVVFPSIPTNDGTVTVTKASDAVSWEYSDDAGDTWNNGTGTTFILQSEPTGHVTYPIGEVVIRNTDAAGNVSEHTSNGTEVTILQAVIINGDLATFYGGATDILNGATAMLIGYPSVTNVNIVGHAAIGDNAFKDATGLTTLNISETTTWDTGLETGTSFTLHGINDIGNYAFQNTGLIDVVIPVDVITIGEYAFNDTPLATISVHWETAISDDAFSNMTSSLSTVTITGISSADELNTWKSNNDSKFSGTGQYPIIFITGTNGIMTETVGELRYVFTVVSSTNVQIGDGSSIPGNGMTTSPVTTLPNFILPGGTYMPNDIQVRSTDAAGNNSTTINNPLELTVYETLTFTLPTTFLAGYYNVIQVGTSAFQNIPITDVTIPSNVTSIGANAFTGIGIVSTNENESIHPMIIVNESTNVVELKSWMSTYGASVSGLNNMSVVFSTINGIMIEMIDGIEYVYTFIDATVNKNVRIGTGVNTGAANGIVGSMTTGPLKVDIPNMVRGSIYSVVQIGTRAFYQIAELTFVGLLSGLVTIEENAFFETGLKSITIPNSVTNIGTNAFANISSLKYVRVPHTGVTYAVGSFFYMNQYSVVSVDGITLPSELTTWKKSIPVPSSSDGTYQIFRASNNGSVYYVMENGDIMARFHKDIVYIITRIDITSVTNLNVRIGTGKTIPGNGIHGPLTTTITPPTDFGGFFNGQLCSYPITQVGKYAFNNTGLTGVVIPKKVVKINIHAFSFDDFNPTFNSVTFASGSQCETIDSYAFMYAGITDVIIPDSVTAIGQSAFRWNGLLSDVTLPVTVVMAAPAFRYMATEVVVKVVTNWWYTFLDWREQNLDKFSTKDLSEVTMTPYYDGKFLFDYIEDAMCSICHSEPIYTVPVDNASIAQATQDVTIITPSVLGDPLQHVFGGEFPPGGDVTWSRRYSVIPFPMTSDIVTQTQIDRNTLALEHTKMKLTQTKVQRIADMTRARSRLNHQYASQSESETNYNTHNYIQVDFFKEEGGAMCARAGHRIKNPYLGPIPGTFSTMSHPISVPSPTSFQSLPSVSSRLNNNHIIPITIPDTYTPSHSHDIVSRILIDGTVANS